jgi:hypothetical protein
VSKATTKIYKCQRDPKSLFVWNVPKPVPPSIAGSPWFPCASPSRDEERARKSKSERSKPIYIYIYYIYKQIKISQHISTCHCLLQITKSVANSPNTCHVTSSCQIIGFTSSFGNFCSWLVVPNKVVSSDLIRSYNCLSIHKIAAVASTSNPGRSFLVYSVSIWIFWPNIPRPLHIPHTRSLRSLRQVAQDIGKTSRIEGIGAALQLATQGARDWGQQRPVLHLEHRSAGAIVLRRIRQLWRPSKCIKMWVCLKI